MKDTRIVFCLLFSLCLHCASQRPHVPWKEEFSWLPQTYDLNKDGLPDVFFACEKDKTSCEETVDWNGDGLPEVHRFFEHGQLVLETYDLNFEGKPSLWVHYLQGKPALKAWDEDGDGEADKHELLLQQNLSDFFKLLLQLFAADAQANPSIPPPPNQECCQALPPPPPPPPGVSPKNPSS